MITLQQEEAPLSNSVTPYVDLSFEVIGQTLPADHGYGLYSALSHWNEEIHTLKGLSIHTITGIPDKQGKIYLTDKSRFLLRLPWDQVPFAYGLAGKSLTIGTHTIRLGIPQIYLLKPSSRLRSRLVVIKGYQEPEAFLEAAQRQIKTLGVQGNIMLLRNFEGERDRKTIKIKRFTVVGFGVQVSDLTDEESILLQQCGIGGKRRMGCGVFVRTKGEV